MNQVSADYKSKNEAFRCGYSAAFQGFSMERPAHLRRRTDARDFEDGWLAGNQVKTSLLAGVPTVRVGLLTAIPVAILQQDGTGLVKWRSDSAGKDYSSAALAEIGLHEKLGIRASQNWLYEAPAGSAA
ncbi:hypothetical protein [Curvibacter gracilis]|uniref:hypothetical protein n=1 Tax=Curvibacter gracilis TaxID=230310 RepID=UPI0012FC0E92|nr:hypothetical protein [Curvibacter gracilis]